MSYYRSLIQTAAVTNPYIANLVAYYKFDANANDFSGNGNNGTVTNAGGLNYTTGKVGNAINFVNSNALNYVQFPDYNDFSFTDGTNDLPFTISCWVNITAFSTTRNVIFEKKGAVNTNTEYVLQIFPSGRIGFTKNNRGGTTIFQSIGFTLPLLINNWYNVIITNSGVNGSTDLNMYINGTVRAVLRTNTGTYLSMSNTTAIARMGQPSWYLDSIDKHRGLLDEFYIWKGREMTATEALDIYNKGNTGIALI